MMEMDLLINTRSVGPVTVIELEGELDSYTCSAFRDAMVKSIDNGAPNVVVNMSAVEYIDSSGLGTLVGGLKRASERSGKVTIVCTSEQIRKVFEITGLEKVFPIFETEDEAVDSL